MKENAFDSLMKSKTHRDKMIDLDSVVMKKEIEVEKPIETECFCIEVRKEFRY